MHRNTAVALTASLSLVAWMLPQASHARSVDDWKLQATLYGWFPSVGGKTSFPAIGGGPSIDLDAEEIVNDLSFVFMGSIEAQKGKWGVWTDLIYVDLDGSKSAVRDSTIGRRAIPAGVDLNANLEIKAWAWTVAGTYSVIATPEHSMQLLAGARSLDLEQKLGWQFNGNVAALPLAATGCSTVEGSLWDGIIGVKGRVSVGANREWLVSYYVDLGPDSRTALGKVWSESAISFIGAPLLLRGATWTTNSSPAVLLKLSTSMGR